MRSIFYGLAVAVLILWTALMAVVLWFSFKGSADIYYSVWSSLPMNLRGSPIFGNVIGILVLEFIVVLFVWALPAAALAATALLCRPAASAVIRQAASDYEPLPFRDRFVRFFQ
jgi:hypothetical protein